MTHSSTPVYIVKITSELIGVSLSEPHTSVTGLRTRVSICLSVYLSMNWPLIGNFKSADLQNLYVHMWTSNSKLILKMIMEFSRSSSTTVDLLSARERLRLEREERATARLQRRCERDREWRQHSTAHSGSPHDALHLH